MPRYAAFLRGVSPMNCKMPELKRCLENAGFTDVKTLLSSGNVVFSAKGGSEAALESKIESALEKDLGRGFPTIVRSVAFLRKMIAADPFGAFKLKPGSKRVVTFLRDKPKAKITLPIERDGARILKLEGRELYSAYVVGPKGPVFMVLIEKSFGKLVTTRTWETVMKVAR
jgi:uncharacterized protein (DUF1697 family)